MASLEVYGFEDLADALHRISDIPDSVIEDSLDAMAEVAADKIRAEGQSVGVRDETSGTHILDSLSRSSKAKLSDWGGYKMITFKGKRRRGNTETRNAEIAFVNEYGRRGQAARPFMGTAMSKNEDAITAPAEQIVGDWIENEYMK